MATDDTSPWTGFLDDASPLGDGPVAARPSDLVGLRVVRDDELPRLIGYAGDVRVLLTGGAAQVSGPGAYAAKHGIELVALETALRDPADPAGNARRVVAALDAALGEGDLAEDTAVLVRVDSSPPTPAWLAAADVLAEASQHRVVVCLSLDAGDPTAWIDAAMDRELEVSLVGGDVHQAVAALQTAARLWGDEADLSAARRWCRGWATDDVDRAIEHLEGLR